MKRAVVLAAWLADASPGRAAPVQIPLGAVDALLEWMEPGGCSGGWTERCMGTAAYCSTRDEKACLAKRKAPTAAAAATTATTTTTTTTTMID